MAVFNVSLNMPQSWVVGDKPDIEGTITKDGSPANNLLGATIRLLKAIDIYLVAESIVTLGQNGQFQFVLPEALSEPEDSTGTIIVTAIEKSTATAQLDGQLASGAISATIKNISGSIPDNGWCLIENEWLSYTLSGSTLTISRGVFETTDATHATDTLIEFALFKETCIERYTFTIEEL
jgi:hypothetical protein